MRRKKELGFGATEQPGVTLAMSGLGGPENLTDFGARTACS